MRLAQDAAVGELQRDFDHARKRAEEARYFLNIDDPDVLLDDDGNRITDDWEPIREDRSEYSENFDGSETRDR